MPAGNRARTRPGVTPADAPVAAARVDAAPTGLTAAIGAALPTACRVVVDARDASAAAQVVSRWP
ncbi:hypothetical protein CNR27_04415 [Luteimonas chenhongjianii]|uniref:Uncharacterized protein n=1 Tax=Luteimonas chenhongjianii TaxID=2006110 RepID=A0A290XCA2_9GAMM|nr:hypothetical protein CNR27_04415 [Luteimonas chenhongjianii]